MPRGIRRALACGVVALSVASVGCSERLAGGLDETQANAIVAVLDAHALEGEKHREHGTEGSFEVTVPGAELGAALRVLDSEGLPRRTNHGVAETYASSGLVPTASEERARYLAAMAGEMATTLERIDGVSDARVHFATSDAGEAVPGEPSPRPRASVLVRVRHGAIVDPTSIARLVAGAMDGLDEHAVSVVRVPAAAARTTDGSLVRIGPVRVARGSAGLLRGMFAASLAIHVLSSLTLVFVLTRTRRRRDAAVRVATLAE